MDPERVRELREKYGIVPRDGGPDQAGEGRGQQYHRRRKRPELPTEARTGELGRAPRARRARELIRRSA